MKRLLALLISVSFAQVVLAGEVLQVSRTGKVIAVSKDYDSQWRQNEQVSVVRAGRQIASATIVKIENKRVLAMVDSSQEKITAGDEVAREYLETDGAPRAKKPFRLGFTTGYGVGTLGNPTNVAGFSVSQVIGSFNFGVNGEIRLGHGWYFQPELSYASKALTAVSAGGAALNAQASKYGYLETFVPIKGRIETGAGPFLAVGPYLGYMVSSPEGTPEDGLNKFSFGLGIGTGLDIRLGKDVSLLLTLRYIKGLTSWTDQGDFKETRFDFITGVNFPL